MQGNIYTIVKTDEGTKGYRNEWKYGPTALKRLHQFFEHTMRLKVPSYAKAFNGADAARLFLATDFENGKEEKLFALNGFELKNPSADYFDDAAGILYIDASNGNFRYCFIDFKENRIAKALDYLLDYMLDVKDEEEKSDIVLLLESIRDIPLMDERELRKSYPELSWEMDNEERSRQMPDTKRRIQEMKGEGLLEPTIGYDYFKNRFYYRESITLDRFCEGSIERKALNELDLNPHTSLYRQSRLLIERDGSAWLQTQHPDLRNQTVFLLHRIEDEYEVLELNLVSTETY